MGIVDRLKNSPVEETIQTQYPDGAVITGFGPSMVVEHPNKSPIFYW